MIPSAAIEVEDVSFRYGERTALDGVGFSVEPGEIFALVGPNGGGKSTLFRLLATLVPPQRGRLAVLGHDVGREPLAVRQQIGVVFQAASLDRKLTVRENLRHQGHLYGLSGATLRTRMDEMLQQFALAARAGELVETLSGGLRRRAELAKGMLHRPRVLLLDEPSTGVDPAARADLWAYLEQVRAADGTTVVLTTHFLDEAEKADRLAILDRGRLVALDTPDALRSMIGGDTITIETDDAPSLAELLDEKFGLDVSTVDGRVRFQQPAGHEWVARLVEAAPGRIRSITVSKPSLEDVFIARTGHRFWETSEETAA